MRKIMNLILIFISISLFSIIELYSQATTFCIEQATMQYPNITCKTTVANSITAYYMGCRVDALINITKCKYFDPNCSRDSIVVIFFNISSIDWNYDSCQVLTQWLFPGYPDNWGTLNEYGFRQMMKSIDIQVATALYVEFYSSLDEQKKALYNCVGTPPNCEFPSCNAVSVIASNAKCEQLCLASKNPGTNGSRYYLGFTPCDDNNQSCCITELKMCMCGNEVKQIETTWPTTFICQGALPPSTGCYIPPDYTPIFNFPYCIAFCEDN